MSREYLAAWRSTDPAGVLYVNTLAIKVDPVGVDIDEPSAQDVADATWNWLKDEYRAVLHPDYTWHDCTVRGILGVDAEAVHAEDLGGTLADIAGDPLPRECAAVITLKTAHVGRSGRGRLFIPSPRVAAYTTELSQWGTGGGFWPALGALGDAILDGHDFSYELGTLNAHISARVWSRVDGLTRDVTAYIRRPDVHWLRSRSTSP